MWGNLLRQPWETNRVRNLKPRACWNVLRGGRACLRPFHVLPPAPRPTLLPGALSQDTTGFAGFRPLLRVASTQDPLPTHLHEPLTWLHFSSQCITYRPSSVCFLSRSLSRTPHPKLLWGGRLP